MTDNNKPVDAEIVHDGDAKPAGESDQLTPTFASPPAPPQLGPDYTEQGVPTFDYVRDRIENRSNTAVGASELAGVGGSGPTTADLDKQLADREEAGKARLAEIRKAMGLE